jgi:hypothetical protein
MKAPLQTDDHRQPSRTAAVFWVLVLAAVYALSCGPAIRLVLWLTAHGYGGGPSGESLFEALEVIYAPLSWLYEHSPEHARRVFDWYTDLWWQ